MAHLVAFLPVEKMILPIQTVEDLASQTEIQYGVLKGGSTMAFFNTSTLPTLRKMWNFMQQYKDDVFVSSNKAGIEKVRRSQGIIAGIKILHLIIVLIFSREICLSRGVHS